MKAGKWQPDLQPVCVEVLAKLTMLMMCSSLLSWTGAVPRARPALFSRMSTCRTQTTWVWSLQTCLVQGRACFVQQRAHLQQGDKGKVEKLKLPLHQR